MKRASWVLALIAVVGLCAGAMACDPAKCNDKTKAEIAKVSNEKGSCDQTTKVANPSCGQSKTTAVANEGCAAKKACEGKANLVANEGCAAKKACEGKANLVANEGCAAKKACEGKANLVANEDCATKKACEGKANLVAKDGKEGCCASKANLVANEDCAAKKACEGKANLVANDGGCCASKATVAASEKAADSCASKLLPKMTFKVGEKTTGCCDEAKKLAESSGSAVLFVVGDKTFSDHAAAMTELANVTDVFVANFAKVSNGASCASKAPACPVAAAQAKKASEGAASYLVAGRTFDCPQKAEKAAKIAQDAMSKVAMTYKVGNESFCCAKMAGEAAKTQHVDTILYVVGNSEPTPCEVTARLKLAEAKLAAALEEIEKSDVL